MRADELVKLVRRQPFQPLRLHLTDGKTYEVRHSDQMIVLRQAVDVGVGQDRETGAAEAVDRVSLPHVVRVETLDSQARREAG